MYIYILRGKLSELCQVIQMVTLDIGFELNKKRLCFLLNILTIGSFEALFSLTVCIYMVKFLNERFCYIKQREGDDITD